MKLSIKGMHCRSCEMLVQDSLKELKNVDSVNVNYKTGELNIAYHGEKPADDELDSAIKKAGYEIGTDGTRSILNKDSKNLKELLIGIGIIFFLYLILRGFGSTDIDFNPDTANAGLALPLFVGLVAGISTCMALIGGLILGLSAKYGKKHPLASSMQKFRPHLFFVGGRIAGYVLFGGILGAIGSVFQLSSVANAALTILVGALMLFIGLQLINLFPKLTSMSLSLPSSVSKFFGISAKVNEEYSHKQAAVLGGLTFFLPCGFTQAMQVFAVSRGNFLEGAMIMGLFALGTAPGLLGIGALTSIVKGSFKNLFFKTVGVAIIALSLFNLGNGLKLLSGGSVFAQPENDNAKEISTDPNVTMENGVQVVRMAQVNRGYKPNKFTIQKDVPVKWVIDGQAQFSCASSLVVPKLNIEKNLALGENIIEFIPRESGKLPFSCSMGMYTGVFNVVEASVNSDRIGNDNQSEGAACQSSNYVNSDAICDNAPKTNNPDSANARIITDTDTKEEIQLIEAVYTKNDLNPSNFTVKNGIKVRFEINAKDSGRGCGREITVLYLTDNAEPLIAGNKTILEFTPTERGAYDITCGMGMIRYGSVIVQ